MNFIVQLMGAIAFLAYAVLANPTEIAKKRMVCYYGSWATYRHGQAKCTVDDLAPSMELCTHVIYTFVGIDENGNIVVLDSWDAIGEMPYKEGSLSKLCKMAHSAGSKCLVAIGGWNEGSEKYSKVMGNPQKRSQLVKSMLAFAKEHNLDGMDLDWEYPGARGGAPADKETFSLLLAQLHPVFKDAGLVLSAAVSANDLMLDTSYEVPALSKYLDMINVMTYDLHGSWDGKTGHNAPLYAGPQDSPDELHLNVESALKAWISRGAESTKINLGMATYGRSYHMSDSNVNGVGAPTSGTAPSGWIDESGMYGYNDICANNQTWTTKWDSIQAVPYVYSGNKWVGYDDTSSIRLKACKALEMNLGGSMVWSLETDDFRGTCGEGKFPLVRAAVTTMAEQTCDSPSGEVPQTTAPPTITEAPTTSLPIPATDENTESATDGNTESATDGNTESATDGSTESATEGTTTSEVEVTTEAPQTGDNVESTTAPIVPPADESINDVTTPSCKQVGEQLPNKNDCGTYFICVYSSDGSIKPMMMPCPTGLGYDSSIKSCNHRTLVKC